MVNLGREDKDLGMQDASRGARAFFFWRCRLFWAAQQLLIVIAAIILGVGLGRPIVIAIIPTIMCAIVAVRELRMGLYISEDGSEVVIRRVFSNLSLDADAVDRLVVNDDLVVTGMNGNLWARSSAALVLKSDVILWVNGSEGHLDDVKRLVREFNSALKAAKNRV